MKAKSGWSRRARVAISGSYGGVNLGDEAILQSIVTHSSYRVMPISMATGQAAGVCAALAARARRLPREVPAGDVQDELRRQGAQL